MNNTTIIVPMKINTEVTTIPMKLSSVVQFVESVDWYEGEYLFQPSDDEQIIEIADKTATQNIVIEPIPNNYGLIEYDGTTIRVS